MAIGASLWAWAIRFWRMAIASERQRALGAGTTILPGISTPILPLVRAAGLEVKDWQNLILGEISSASASMTRPRAITQNGNLYNESTPTGRVIIAIMPASITIRPTIISSMPPWHECGVGAPDYAAGPNMGHTLMPRAVAREQWQVTPPYVDPDGYCFSANTLQISPPP